VTLKKSLKFQRSPIKHSGIPLYSGLSRPDVINKKYKVQQSTMVKKQKPVKEEPVKVLPKKIKKPLPKLKPVEVKKQAKFKKIEKEESVSKSLKSASEKISIQENKKRKNEKSEKDSNSALFAEFLTRFEIQIKQHVLESLEPLLYQKSKEIISEEVQTIRHLIENIKDSVSEKINGLENSINEHFRDLSSLIDIKQLQPSEDWQGSEARNDSDPIGPITSTTKLSEKLKRLKKRGRPLKLNKTNKHSEEERTFKHTLEETNEKKKRGRKPKSFYAEQSNPHLVLESQKEVESNGMAGDYIEEAEDRESSVDQNSHEAKASIEASSAEEVQPNIKSSKSATVVQVDEDDEKEEEGSEDVESPQLRDKINFMSFTNFKETVPVAKIAVPEKPVTKTIDISIVEPENMSKKEDISFLIKNTHRTISKEIENRLSSGLNPFFIENNRKHSEEDKKHMSSFNDSKYQHDAEVFSFN
jgi:hypothetical protein